MEGQFNFHQMALTGTIEARPGNFVAAVYENKWYIGQVMEVENDEVYINFMQKCGKISALKWPPKKDEIWVNLEQLLCVIEAPVKTKRMFHIPDLILENI